MSKFGTPFFFNKLTTWALSGTWLVHRCAYKLALSSQIKLMDSLGSLVFL